MPNIARPDHEPTVVMAFRIRKSLADEFKIVTLDPRTGRRQYKKFSATMERIIQDWLDTQKVTPP